MKAHKLSRLFPPMPKEKLRELAKDIKQRGQLTDIITLENQILDGVQRESACGLIGIKPRRKSFESLNGEVKKAGPLAFVISANLHRRHLSTQQRAEAAAKLLPLLRGNNCFSNDKQFPNKRGKKAGRPLTDNAFIAQAAKLMNVSSSSVTRARKGKPKKRASAKLYVPNQNTANVAWPKGWKPQDFYPGTDVTYQLKWYRSLMIRAREAVAMLEEDWSMYEIDAELVNAARQASAAWEKIATQLERQMENT